MNSSLENASNEAKAAVKTEARTSEIEPQVPSTEPAPQANPQPESKHTPSLQEQHYYWCLSRH